MQNTKENKSYVTAQFLKKRAREEDVVNQESYRMLQLQQGMQVLEVGCGPGTSTDMFSGSVGIGGFVVDVDCDPIMIQQANISSKQYSNVVCMVGDAHKLPFEDGKFDRVYAKRLFQVLPPASSPFLIAELQRVLKPGGFLVLVDTDWTSVGVNFSDLELERRLTSFFRDRMRPNGLAGRQLLELTRQGGFLDGQVKVLSIVIRDFSETPFSDWLVTEALKAKVATTQEMDRWCSELEEKTAQQAFFFHVGTVIVAAKRMEK
ncbi:MAG: methyltransferase domain-containing protein [Candidatus Bathyarchaeota archaeon]|nr:methyltransferase domain-containing protein [Candidatus Bathyarchaeota archaeon]